MKLYVYCIAERIEPSISSGISGAEVRNIEIEGLSVLASEFAGETTPVTRENVLTHDSVIRGVLDHTTPLPFRFGTLTTQKDLASFVEARRSTIEARLALVRGCVEMNVKIISNPDRADSETDESDLGPGATFLEKKRREILGSGQAKEVAEWLQNEVAGSVREEHVSLCPTEKLIVAAAHLVERGQVAVYRDRVGNARKLRPELHFLVSGPWPPYSFANIDLEFKTRFGVS